MHDGLSTQVAVNTNEGLKHHSSIHCDELMSLPKAKLTNYIGTLSTAKKKELEVAMLSALDIND
jgi:mRNA interferase MazF